ncbi:envelope stress response membrane protein PspC [Shewanella sp. VB17]|uniref:envelope stress response membrane protein PspC n=1 Tax=Shewanella sp. VB17 TaxID=2739432 RepID=UPI0015632BB1|nr:envelope stress response membrane protein PspC [Shewanella sp. VB17]NRD73466.1 envelope stress response membrane protein PspC [Shewanella sp. VB17]
MSKASGRTLYRIPQSGKIAGVCAGIADYFNFETWLVRVAAASIFLLGGGGPVLFIYILLWVILDAKPGTEKSDCKAHKDIEIKQKVWQAGEPAKMALRDVSDKFKALEVRLQKLERHVTSGTFDLKQEINNL